MSDASSQTSQPHRNSFIFQGRKRMGRWPSRSCLVCRTVQPLEVGTGTTAHQKLEATDPSPGQSGLKVECEAQANVFTGFTTKSWKRCVFLRQIELVSTQIELTKV